MTMADSFVLVPSLRIPSNVKHIIVTSQIRAVKTVISRESTNQKGRRPTEKEESYKRVRVCNYSAHVGDRVFYLHNCSYSYYILMYQ